jgi:hypothetical protein
VTPARRNRTTFRITDENFDFLDKIAKDEGVNMNIALNIVLSRLRRQQSDSKVTASTSQRERIH